MENLCLVNLPSQCFAAKPSLFHRAGQTCFALQKETLQHSTQAEAQWPLSISLCGLTALLTADENPSVAESIFLISASLRCNSALIASAHARALLSNSSMIRGLQKGNSHSLLFLMLLSFFAILHLQTYQSMSTQSTLYLESRIK